MPNIELLIREGSIHEINKYLDEGGNLNCLTSDGMDYLSCSIDSGQPEIAKLLIQKGININGHVKSAFTPIQSAILAPNYEMIKLLVKSGVNLNYKGSEEIGYPLHLLCEGYLDKEFFELFINNGANINAQDDNGKTPLQLQVEFLREGITDENLAHSIIIGIFLSHNPEIDIEDNYGNSTRSLCENKLLLSTDEIFKRIAKSILSGDTSPIINMPRIETHNYFENIKSHCLSNGYQIPPGYHKREAFRYFIINHSFTPPKLIALTFPSINEAKIYIYDRKPEQEHKYFQIFDGASLEEIS